jgi:hypothetical protein
MDKRTYVERQIMKFFEQSSPEWKQELFANALQRLPFAFLRAIEKTITQKEQQEEQKDETFAQMHYQQEEN